MKITPVIFLALALAPIAFFFTYVYLRDKYDREPLKYLIITFVLGISTAAPIIYLGDYIQEYTGLSIETSPFLYAFAVVALMEEGLKYLVLRWYNYPHKEFDEPYDGIMYGVAVSLGFAAIENVLYVFWSEGEEVETAMLRMFTAVPAHAAFGVLMGYFVGRAKFLEKGKRWLERMKGLGAAILVHGAYDFFLFQGSDYLIPFAFVTLILSILLARMAIRIHIVNSPHSPAAIISDSLPDPPVDSPQMSSPPTPPSDVLPPNPDL